MNDQCCLKLLESALAGTLSPQDEQSLGDHLESCAECSAHLEHLAGGPAWGRHAAALLVGDELDESLPARDEWWDVDFSVEHLEPSNDPSALGRVGPYDILEIVGRGGMGVVLKGFDPELKRCVAIKVLAPQLAQSSLAKKRFTREAQAAAAVMHPNVLAIHQVQPNGRLPFLVMPFVAGESLAQRLAAQGTLGLKEILRIGTQVAAGLAAAHEQGLVHRDVKPANILLEKGVERAVITDFGLARAADDVSITRLGIIAGTPQYMSPEQARGEALDGRSDLFSLGCVLYEMATGVSPFRADSAMATMRRLVEEAPQALASLNPELPPWFCAIVERLMEKDRGRRFGSAKEASDLLEACLAHLQQPTGVPLPAALASVGRVCDPAESSGHDPGPSDKKPIGQLAHWSLLAKGAVFMTATLGIALATFLAFVDPPDIAGEWSGPGWGTIVLKPLRGAEYAGSYTDAFGKKPGAISLSWSRLESRFVGTWRDADNSFGEMSLRLVGSDIQGAYTTGPKSKINSGKPRLAEFAWTRGGTGFLPIVERAVDGAIDFETGNMAKLPELKTDAGEMADAAKWMEKNKMDACFDAQSLLVFGMKVVAGGNEDWEKATPAKIAVRILEIEPADSMLSRLRPGANGPGAYIIQTREGGIGLVQVLGFEDDDKAALKIRYKLASITFDAVAKEVKAMVKDTKQAFLDGERKIAFSMNDKPWREVMDWIVDQTGLVYISVQPAPAGSFKFVGPKEATYSFPEVIDIINEGLQQTQHHFVRRDASFSVFSADKPLDGTLVARVTADQLEKRGKTEIVQVLVPLKAMNAVEYAPEVKRQLGPFGSVVALTAANQLLVQDSAGNLRRLMKAIDLIEKDDETETFSYKCVYVKASDAELFLKDILGFGDPFGSRTKGKGIEGKGNEGFGSGGAPQPRVAGMPRIRSDDRTNTVFVNARPNKIAQAKSYLAKFDQPQFAGQQPRLIGAAEIKHYDIPDGNAEFLVKVLSEFPAFRPAPFFRMSAVSPTRIMVYAGPEDQRMVAKELDGQIPAPSKTKTIDPMEENKKPAVDPVSRKRFRFQTAAPVREIAYSPDEALIAVAADPKAVTLLDAKTGAIVRTLKAMTADEEGIFQKIDAQELERSRIQTVELAFAPDSKVLAVGNVLGQAKLFDVATGTLLHVLDRGIRDPKQDDWVEGVGTLVRAHVGPIGFLAFSPDGATLATCSAGRGDSATLWDAKTGALRKESVENLKGVMRVAFAPDGKTLAGVYSLRGQGWAEGLAIYEVPSGQKLTTVNGKLDESAMVAFMPDGKRLAISYRAEMQIVYPASKVVENSWTAPINRPFTVSPDGKFIAAPALTKAQMAVALWDTNTGSRYQSLNMMPRLPGERHDALEYSIRTGFLVVGGVDAEGRGFVEAWDSGITFANASLLLPAKSKASSGKGKKAPAPGP